MKIEELISILSMYPNNSDVFISITTPIGEVLESTTINLVEYDPTDEDVTIRFDRD